MLSVCLPGTGGFMPLGNRWLTCCWMEYQGGALLIDCGEGTQVLERIAAAPARDKAPFSTVPKGNERAIWLEPNLVGTVRFMERTASGSLRQPVFKGIRNDKAPEDCMV